MRKIIMAVSFLAVVLLLEGTGWSQCAMCRTALENSAEGEAVAQGFRSGIMFLLAAPYAIMGGISYGLVKAYKKQKTPPKA
jgi:hypothetical protein